MPHTVVTLKVGVIAHDGRPAGLCYGILNGLVGEVGARAEGSGATDRAWAIGLGQDAALLAAPTGQPQAASTTSVSTASR